MKKSTKILEFFAIFVICINIILNWNNLTAFIGWSLCLFYTTIIAFTDRGKKFYSFFKKPKFIKSHNYKLLVIEDNTDSLLEYYGITKERYDEIKQNIGLVENQSIYLPNIIEKLINECKNDNELIICLYRIGYNIGYNDNDNGLGTLLKRINK